MATLGRAALIIGFAVSLYAVAAALHGARSGRSEWTISARRAIYALLGVLTLAIVILEAAFLRSDFSFGLVADNSSTTTPTFYKLTAMWSSQSGSLLLWVWVLALFSSAVLYFTRRRHREVVPYATAVLGGIAAFFTALLVFEVSPFTTIANPPAEGTGLNPLLRHPMMLRARDRARWVKRPSRRGAEHEPLRGRTAHKPDRRPQRNEDLTVSR